MNLSRYKNIFTNKLFKPMFIVYILLSIAIYVLVPYQLDKVLVKSMEKDSLELIHFLEAAKMYYNDYIIDDVIQYEEGNNQKITFALEHKKEVGILPLPAIFLSDLSEMTNKNRITQLYSYHPFKNRLDRELSPSQKRILDTIEDTPNGVILEKQLIDGVEYIGVAKINYMTSERCIQCHNSHEDSNWAPDKWKVGDMRGVLETITPMDSNIKEDLDNIKYNIIVMIIISFLAFLIYYGWIVSRNECELKDKNTDLTDQYNDTIQKLNLKNISLEHDMGKMFTEFDKNVIYSKTNLFGVITEVSQAFCDISGYSKEELIDSNHNILKCSDTDKEMYKELWKTIEANEVWSGDMKNQNKEGNCYWTRTVISPTYDDNGVKIGYTSIKHNLVSKDKSD